MSKKTKTILYITKWIVFSVIILFVCGVCYSLFTGLTGGKPDFAENIDSVSLLPKEEAKWLPAEATNISYYRKYGMGGMGVFEFTISENNFLKWTKKHKYPVERTTETPFVIGRYTRYLKKYKKSSSGNMSDEEFRNYFGYKINMTIENGYKYEKRYGNGGGTSVGFDLNTGRAYYNSSHR